MLSSRALTEDYTFIIGLIYERCGIRLHLGKEQLIQARLAKRLRHHGFQHLHEYCHFLKEGADEAEMTEVVNALTTNFTQFWREPEHFEFLAQEALPAWRARRRPEFRLWSCACATGEEPYTAAFQLSQCGGPALAWHIVGTDVSTKALAHARLGIYAADRVRPLPQTWLQRFFQRGEGQWAGYYRIKKSFRERLQFDRMNLLESACFAEQFDVIFCRNVLIYFDGNTQAQVVGQLLNWLAPGGFLLVGHSETISGFRTNLRCLRPSIYQKADT